ncbi:hypothetical protein [Stutzerimonas nitrititolerans]|uniref:hypothetical protein n=1 Tax=Stutzerimonas nitrititolerans TaxID=2482751 RepID=UPI00289E1760|nr:hypothetical protein [Stutzerimonas nitrititolerans]
MNIESNILGCPSSNSYILGCSEAIDGFRSVPSLNYFKAANYFRSEYPKIKRYIDIRHDAMQAVKAALSTSSGLYDSVGKNVLAENVHNINKAALVKLVMSRSGSIEKKIEFAAEELAKEVLVGLSFEDAVSTLDTDGLLTEQQERDVLQKSVSKHTERFDTCVGKFEHLLTYKKFPAEKIRDTIFRVPRRALLQCHTGFGKTSIILESQMKSFMSQGKRVLFISPLRSIVKAIDIPGLIDYQDVMPGQMSEALGLKVVVNSLISPKFADFVANADLVVIDEASQVIEHVFDGTVRDREDVWSTLKSVVKQAKNVVFADADINQACLDLITNGTDPVVVFKAEAAHGDIAIEVGQLDQIRKQAMDSALSENTVIACDNKRDASAMALALEKAGRQVMLITSTTSGYAQQQAFLKNPNSSDYEVLIYSPAMKSAISITSGHFTRHFGLFEGSVSPKGAIQMLRRDRKAKSFLVGVRNPQNRTSELVEVEYQYSRKTKFDEMRYQHRKGSAWLKDNIQLTLSIELRRQGFSVINQATNDEQGMVGFKERSKTRRALKINIAKSVLNATAMPDRKVAEVVVRDGASSPTEYYSAIRAEAEYYLKKSALTLQDTEFWQEGQGKQKLNNFEKLHQSNMSLHRMLARIFKGMSQTKSWSSADSIKAFDEINCVRAEALIAGFNLPKASKLISDRSKQGAISELMRACGLKTKRVDGGSSGYYYIIDPKSLEQMKGYTGL